MKAINLRLQILVAALPALYSVGSVAEVSYARSGLEEIVVTAQKREQNLQDTPISLTAITAEKLEMLGVGDMTDLTKHTPNLQIYATPGDKAGATINMRGMSTTSPQITYEPTVGLYVDGLFVAKASGNILELIDVERIEVLRGPQGTLYGRNTIAGAINIINRKPTGELGGNIKAGVGNFNARTLKGMLNLPAIGETGEGLGQLSTKIAYSSRVRDGLFDNVPSTNSNRFLESEANHPSSDLADQNSKGFRVDLLWDLNESFSVQYLYENQRIREQIEYFQLTNITACGIFDPNCPAGPGGSSFLGVEDFASKDRLSTAHNSENRSNIDVDAHGVIMDWDLGNWGALGDVSTKFLWGNRKIDWSVRLDQDGTDIELADYDTEYSYEQDSYELQFTGKTGTVDYVLGLYYFEEEGFVDATHRFFGVFSPRPNGTALDDYGINKDIAEAVFAQATWTPSLPALKNRLSLTAGGRYTHEEKDVSRYRLNAGETIPAVDIPSAVENFHNASTLFSVGWELSETINLYAKYAEGYKAGGFTSQAGSPEEFLDGFDPELAESIEVGIKSRWMDNRLQVNAAAFTTDYNDLQVTIFKQIPAGDSFVLGTVIDNAGQAEISGLELEVEFQATDNLYISTSYAYLDPDYVEYLDNETVNGEVVTVDIKSDKSFSFSPQHAGSVNIEYRIPETAIGDLSLWVNWSYRGEVYGSAAKSASEILPGRSLTDMRLSLDEIPVFGSGNFTVALWGRNIFDEEYPVSSIDYGGFGYTGWSWGVPRTYGIDLSYAF